MALKSKGKKWVKGHNPPKGTSTPRPTKGCVRQYENDPASALRDIVWKLNFGH